MLLVSSFVLPHAGGVEQFVATLRALLEESGHEVRVLACRRPGQDTTADAVLPSRFIGPSGWPLVTGGRKTLWKEVERADAIVANGSLHLLTGAGGACGPPPPGPESARDPRVGTGDAPGRRLAAPRARRVPAHDRQVGAPPVAAGLPGAIGFVALAIFSNALVASSAPGRSSAGSLVSLTLGVVLDLVLIPPYGASGAAAAAAGGLLACGATALVLYRRLEGFPARALFAPERGDLDLLRALVRPSARAPRSPEPPSA